MARVIYGPGGLAQLEDTYRSLRAEDPSSAATALHAVCSVIAALAAHPLLGRRLDAGLRELTTGYGPTQCITVYRFDVPRDEVRVLAVRRSPRHAALP